MGQEEMVWRLVGLKISQADFVTGVLQVPDHVDTATRLLTGNVAVAPGRPQAVR
jgi:hypothetical protein